MSDPLAPSPLSGPVDDDDECAALRAEEQIRADVASDPARHVLAFRGPRTVIARLIADVPALLARLAAVERDLAEARAQLAKARRTVSGLVHMRDRYYAEIDKRCAAETRLEAVQARLQPSALFDVIYDAMYGSASVHAEEREAVAQLAEALAAALLDRLKFAAGQAIANEQLRTATAEQERDEARAQLAEAQASVRKWKTACGEWITLGTDLEARLEAVQTSRGEWRRLAEYALHLAMYGEHAPGGWETWNEFERRMRSRAAADSALAVSPPEPEAKRNNPHQWDGNEICHCGRGRYAVLHEAYDAAVAAPQPVDQPKCEHGEEQR